ncbi:MAG TPA: sigma-70 family RNA polymerase sigma factor [Vicinamibacterales bacterium]
MRPDRSRRREFEQVAVKHLDEIYRYACRLTRQPPLAEDLTQETFLQAWSSFARFEPGTNCRAWLYRIFHHVHSHARRRSNRETARVEMADLPDHALLYDPPLPRVFDRRLVQDAFGALPPDARELLLLAEVEGFTYREIASILEIPIGTVMSRLNRARKRLRALVISKVNESAPPRVSGERG